MRALFIAVLLAFSLSADEEIGLIGSSPDQIASLMSDGSFLIGGCVHPLSGQLSLSSVDLVAKGTQPLSLFRVFVPGSIAPPPPLRHSEMQEYSN